MKRKILLLMMTALLSVGAWAENLLNESKTLANYGFQLTEAKSMSVGDVLTFTVSETTTGWAGIKLKTVGQAYDGNGYAYAIPGTELISTSAVVGTVKIVVTSEVAGAAADKGLWLDGNDCTVTSVNLEKKQPTLNIFSGSESFTWSTSKGLSSSLFSVVQAGDLLTIEISAVGDSQNGDDVSLRASEWGDDILKSAKAYSATTVTFEFDDDLVTAAKTKGLYIRGTGFTITSVDLIYKPSAVNIGSEGYATFGYPFAVYLSGLSASQDAYTVTVDGDKAQLTSVKGKKIPANTGIILKGSNNDVISLPLTTDDTDAIGTNNLHVSDGTVTGVTDDGSTIYALAKKNDVVGFYKLKDDVTVPAGKAYLKISSGGAALAPAFIGFGGGTTGIDNLTPALSNGEEVYYDLQGRRVAQPTKGLYIVNGKKVIIK